MATYDLKYPGAAIDAILDTAYHLQQAGYIFRGSASDYSGTPTEREWVIAPAGFTGYGISSPVPQGSIGICLYNGTSWVGKIINVATIDSTPTQNSGNAVSSGGVYAAIIQLSASVTEALGNLTFTDTTPSAFQDEYINFKVSTTEGGVERILTYLTILAATTSKAGLMSAEDKAKVDSFLANLRSLTFADTTASADQGTQITETLKATIGGVQEVIDSITLLAATSSKAGLLSASDKAYIDALPATLTNLSNSISAALALMESLVGYYTCDTAAATAAKTVTATGYSLTNGGCIRIKMTNANTAANVTLNINSTGAKALYYDGAQASSTNTWEAGEVLEVYYDGTQYQCASGGGGKFATGENVSDVSLENEVIPNSDGLVKGGALAELLLTVQPTGETIDISTLYQFTSGKYISLSNGVIYDGVSSWLSTEDYISIGSGWISVEIGETGGSSSSAAVAFYDTNKTYIGGSPCGTATTITIPNNAKYVRFCKATANSVHTIILGEPVDNFTILHNEIEEVQTDLETNYSKIAKEIDYLPQAVTGVAWKASAIGSAIVRTTNGAFESIKIPCKKGDVFGIIANSFGNSFPVVVTDDNDIVLYYVYGGSSMVGGVFEIAHNDAAWLYVSGYNTSAHNAIDKCSKIPVTHDDVIECTGEYVQSGCLAITNQYGEYGNLKGIGIPMLIKHGDVVHIKFISKLNYRGYILKNPVDGNIMGYISDSDMGYSDIDFVWNGTDAYLHIVGDTDNPPYACKYSRSVALAMKNANKRFVSLGDSITSYDASDVGEYIRGMIGAAWCKTSDQVDWGNIAEGNATITNTEDTTVKFNHSDSTIVNNRYVNRTLPNEVLKLLQHITPLGEQITWTIKSNNTTYSIETSLGVGTGYTSDIPDIIYIAMGTNDWDTTDDYETVIAQNYGSLTKLTICSSLRWCIETLQNVFPKAVIVCVTPIMRGNRTVAEQETKCSLIKKICNYMAVPVVDGYHISGFNPYTYSIYSGDAIHPNTHTQRIARSIAAQVNALI